MGRDYPLTKVKYAALLGIVPLVLADGALELAYFAGLKTDVITSCCSKLFVPNNPNLANQMAGVGPGLALGLLGAAGAGVALSGVVALWTGRGLGAYAVASGALFAAGLTAVVSAISVYIYENPNHHCPFCILKPEYGYFGYALYAPLFTGTALGLGAGMLSLFRATPSLAGRLPGLIRAQVIWSLAGFGLFGAAVLWAIARSHLILFG
jgi:hypothetical protein